MLDLTREDVNILKIYYKPIQPIIGTPQQAVELAKEFDNWVNNNALDTLVVEFSQFLLALGYCSETVKESLIGIAENYV